MGKKGKIEPGSGWFFMRNIAVHEYKRELHIRELTSQVATITGGDADEIRSQALERSQKSGLTLERILERMKEQAQSRGIHE